MRRAIAMLSSDSVLTECCDKIQDVRKRYSEKFIFLKKQFEDFKSKADEESNPLWEKMHTRAKELNLMPKDYDPEKQYLSFSSEENILYIESKDHNDAIVKIFEGSF